MKKTIIFLFFIGICFNIYSQFIYTKQNSVSNNFLNVFEESVTNNLLVTCGNYSLNTGLHYANAKTTILKISPTGFLLDTFAIGGIFATAGKMINHNNNYYLYGTSSNSTNLNNRTIYPTVYKFDSNFKVIQKTILDSIHVNSVSTVQNTVIINNSLYLLYFYGVIPKAKLFKLSLNLQIIDSMSFKTDGTYSMIKQGNNLVISGSGLPKSSIWNQDQALKIDTSFNEINRYNFDSLAFINSTSCGVEAGLASFSNMIEISNNTYYVTGFYGIPYAACNMDDQVVYAIIKNNSKVLNCKNYGTQNGVRESYANYNSTADIKGKYIFNTCVSKFTNGIALGANYTPTSILTAKIDTSGNLIWQKYFNTPNYYYQPMAVCATVDSGVVVTGMRFNTIYPTLKDSMEGFVLKYDKNGNEVAVSINEHYQTFVEVNLYPNPASNETTLKINSGNEPSVITITITDMYGKTVYHHLKTMETGLNTITLNTQTYANGLYQVTIGSNKSSITKKLSIIN